MDTFDGWQPTVDRILLNAALTTLTQGWDKQAALLVIEQLDSLPEIADKQKQYITRTNTIGSSVSGHTPEHGTVSIRNKDAKDVKEVVAPPKRVIAHVGSFQITKMISKNKRFFGITFGPFQQELEPLFGAKQPPPNFQLIYHADSKRPYGLDRLEWVPRPPSLKIQLIALGMFFRKLKIPIMNSWTSHRVIMIRIAEGEL